MIKQTFLKKRLLAISYDSVKKNFGNCMTVEVLKINGVHFFLVKIITKHYIVKCADRLMLFKRLKERFCHRIVLKVVNYDV